MSGGSVAPAWRRWLVRSLRLGLGAVFVCAGVLKAKDPAAFADSVASFRLLPEAANHLVALGLPPLEILAGGLLWLAGRWRRSGAFAVLAMLAAFLVALGSAQARGLVVDCGCFGAGEWDILSSARNLWLAIGRDALFAACAWLVYQDARRKENAPAARES